MVLFSVCFLRCLCRLTYVNTSDYTLSVTIQKLYHHDQRNLTVHPLLDIDQSSEKRLYPIIRWWLAWNCLLPIIKSFVFAFVFPFLVFCVVWGSGIKYRRQLSLWRDYDVFLLGLYVVQLFQIYMALFFTTSSGVPFSVADLRGLHNCKFYDSSFLKKTFNLLKTKL